ncbi:hypothetical protein GS493_09715 [Rhodococcus hoagii]|nr:hypothetical protein [Prescottella equi]
MNHTSVAPTGSNNTYELQMGAQTTPGSSGLYTLVGLEQIKTVYSINPSTFVSARSSAAPDPATPALPS